MSNSIQNDMTFKGKCFLHAPRDAWPKISLDLTHRGQIFEKLGNVVVKRFLDFISLEVSMKEQ